MLDLTCCFCGLPIAPSRDPKKPVQRVGKGTWAHWACWALRKPEPMEQADHYREEQMVMFEELGDE